jgi:hypothetical protein
MSESLDVSRRHLAEDGLKQKKLLGWFVVFYLNVCETEADSALTCTG